MPERRKAVRAEVMAAVSSAARVELHRAEARWTWVMDARERLEARRCGRRVSRDMGAGEEAAAAAAVAPAGVGCAMA